MGTKEMQLDLVVETWHFLLRRTATSGLFNWLARTATHYRITSSPGEQPWVPELLLAGYRRVVERVQAQTTGNRPTIDRHKVVAAETLPFPAEQRQITHLSPVMGFIFCGTKDIRVRMLRTSERRTNLRVRHPLPLPVHCLLL